MMEKQQVKPILKDSYLKLIKNSVGAKVWRNFYAEVDGRKKDILKDGELSCAFFASSVLLMSGLIKKRHATVRGTVKDMVNSGWQEVKKPKQGCVLVWEKVYVPGSSKHRHIGFYHNNKLALSNSHKHKSPQIHHITYGRKKDGSPVRKIEKIFWHKKLEK